MKDIIDGSPSIQEFLRKYGTVKPMPNNSELVKNRYAGRAWYWSTTKLHETLECLTRPLTDAEHHKNLLIEIVGHDTAQLLEIDRLTREVDNLRLRIQCVDAEHADMERQKHRSIEAFMSIERQLAIAQVHIGWMQTVSTEQVHTIRELKEQLNALRQK